MSMMTLRVAPVGVESILTKQSQINFSQVSLRKNKIELVWTLSCNSQLSTEELKFFKETST